ncbi:Uncharacterised protein [Mycobacteroides abscessus subsp. massiliense]|nr:Uncharacterised protein [Mycobacteroides abscessus subsp. massiliense]SKS32884.1 Uncharacterised protein [Mycobacteroides abscessus subsp. abscessus]SLB47234.1 Uncharacterised protein [Mycobacteroides abscessus subsp. massiliense]SLC94115.1 Uncharacterised protein [Mycobacteroides abscessus subsp. massiliense]
MACDAKQASRSSESAFYAIDFGVYGGVSEIEGTVFGARYNGAGKNLIGECLASGDCTVVLSAREESRVQRCRHSSWLRTGSHRAV